MKNSDELLVAREGELWTVTINRPEKMNPLSRPVLRSLHDAFAAAAEDDAVKCIVVRGAGDRYFAAGGDLRDLADVRTERGTEAMVTGCRSALDAVRDCPVPVVALLNGDAIGGGAELAVACDFRVMADHARLGFIHARLALTPAWGGGVDLIDLVGASRALRMMARSELVPAGTAQEWGLADAVVPRTQVDAGLRDFIGPMLAQSVPVLRAFKAQAIAARRGRPMDERRALEQRHIVASWTHPDHWAAVERILGGGDERT